MRRKTLFVCVMFMLIAGLCFAFDTVKHPVEFVSLMQLIVNPEKYHGKRVSVVGVSKNGFEVHNICFSKEHSQYGITQNCLWIIPDHEALKVTSKELEGANGKYVLMEGIFNKENHGHLGAYAGTLENITRFEERTENIKIKESVWKD